MVRSRLGHVFMGRSAAWTGPLEAPVEWCATISDFVGPSSEGLGEASWLGAVPEAMASASRGGGPDGVVCHVDLVRLLFGDPAVPFMSIAISGCSGDLCPPAFVNEERNSLRMS